MLSHLDNAIPIPPTYSRQQPSTLGQRQLFDSDMTSPCVPFTDLFNSPSVHDKRMAQSWDWKLEAVNRWIAYISRQMTNMKQMMTLMMQNLCDISGTGNTTNNTEQAPSHSTNNTLSEEISLMSGSVTATYVDTALSLSSTAAINDNLVTFPLIVESLPWTSSKQRDSQRASETWRRY